jgi:hypothetical protein
MPANNIETKTLDRARPPLIGPTNATEKSINFRDNSPLFIIFAAKINNGTATNTKEFKPLNIFIGIVIIVIPGTAEMPINEVIPITKAIGTPINISIKKITGKNKKITGYNLRALYIPLIFFISLTPAATKSFILNASSGIRINNIF